MISNIWHAWEATRLGLCALRQNPYRIYNANTPAVISDKKAKLPNSVCGCNYHNNLGSMAESIALWEESQRSIENTP